MKRRRLQSGFPYLARLCMFGLAVVFICMATGARTQDGMVNMDIRKADILEVVQLLAASASLNIVAPDELQGEVTVRLNNVHWADALDSILRSKGFGYERQGNVIRIDALERLQSSLTSKVFVLRYVDATDVKPFLEGVLSEQGKITTLTEKGRSAYALGAAGTGEQEAQEGAVATKSRVLSITDTQDVIENATGIIDAIDVEPKQISIEVQIVEVVHSKNSEIGIDWNIEGSLTGASQPLTFPFPGAVGGPFLPSGSGFPTPSDASFTFGTLDASNFRATLKLLATRGELNVLSSPKITTLNNLEASILIGEHFPITTESIDAETGLRTISLDHYEDIGIQLIVIPQTSGDNAINMIIHPAVSSLGDLVENRYPRINTREADTQILVQDSHTIVIGGLLQDRDNVNLRKVPVLGSIPILKYLFRHKTTELQKVELLIFVTPRIVQGAAQGLNRDVTVNTLPETLMENVDKKLGLKPKKAKLENPVAEAKGDTGTEDNTGVKERRSNKHKRGGH